MNDRNSQIDILKGLGIFCVVLGHCQNIGDVGELIYSFHMPLFFFCSGFLMYNKPNVDFKLYTLKKFKQIMKSYTIFFILSMAMMYLLIKNFVQNDYTQSLDWTPSLKKILISYVFSGRYLYDIPLMNFALWYLPLYLISILVYYWIRKLLFNRKKSYLYIMISMGVLFFITQPINNLLLNNSNGEYVKFSIQVLCPAIFFMLIGSLFKIISLNSSLNDKLFKLRYVPISAVLGLFINRIHPSQILNSSKSFMIGAILIIYVLYTLTLNSSNIILKYLGQNSLLIYGLHRPMIYFMQNSFINDFLINHKVTDIFNYLIITIIVISIILLIDILIKHLINIIKNSHTS